MVSESRMTCFDVVVTTSICYVALDSLVRLDLNKVRNGLKYPG